MRLLSRLVLFLTVYNGTFTILDGQDQNYTHFKLRSGLPTGYTSTMTEDRYGYIWKGATDGLSKSDRYNFIKYTHVISDSTFPKGSNINTISDDNSSRMITATTIAISTKKGQNATLITISDNGPCILEEIKGSIFLPLFTTKAAGEGTGLGLRMSYYKVTKGHGESLSPASKKEKELNSLFQYLINQHENTCSR